MTSRSTANTMRDRPIVTMGAREPIGSHHMATQRTHLQPPIRPPVPPIRDSQSPVKTCIANCGQTVPDVTMVCIHSLQREHTTALPNSAIVDPVGAPLPQKRVVKMPSIGCVVPVCSYTVMLTNIGANMAGQMSDETLDPVMTQPSLEKPSYSDFKGDPLRLTL